MVLLFGDAFLGVCLSFKHVFKSHSGRFSLFRRGLCVRRLLLNLAEKLAVPGGKGSSLNGVPRCLSDIQISIHQSHGSVRGILRRPT